MKLYRAAQTQAQKHQLPCKWINYSHMHSNMKGQTGKHINTKHLLGYSHNCPVYPNWRALLKWSSRSFQKLSEASRNFQKPSRRFQKAFQKPSEASRSNQAHRNFEGPHPHFLEHQEIPKYLYFASFGRVGAKIYFFWLQPHLLHDIPRHDGRPPRGRPSCRDCHEQVRWKSKAKNLSAGPSERTEK